MNEKQGARRKYIRYFRWLVKAAFLLIFTLPIAYFVDAAPLPMYSIFYGGLNQPLLVLPYGQSVCSTLLFSYAYVGPGAWLICPVGGLQALLTGNVELSLLLPTIAALLLFLIPIFVLGNVFCGWVCPLGTMIDSFDKAVERFMPKMNIAREERFQRSKEKNEAPHGFVCPTCPFARLLSNKSAAAANGVLVSSLVGSAAFRFPVFCAVCPIGVATKGMFHLKSLTSITGKMMPIISELSVFPVVAILASLREKRYWCRKICPVGAVLNIAGSFSPLIRPTVKPEKCVMQGCPKTCEDYRMDYCGACRQIDQKRCEKVCPQGINLLDKGSLARCTKCLECYIQCGHDALSLEPVGTPDAVSLLKRFFKAKSEVKPRKLDG
ncbi:MAG: 4Fe-4S binding protein [Candidatus Bathyarchaeota archaeon]|nr:4Fe-4S binding protein [Candidatus Bathyarchaeota archaeon]